ncbi:hypothetical protein HZH68_007627 [Vespula germanica]|uniref:Uncharacterized protein n=1 Tax=Vespula germanica TaxID=30212 RepID=A0A834NA46_VESGE|nr:hypothetical protein HZH68_007627 [Vespula germanica]
MAIYPRIDAGRKNIGFPLGVPSCPPRLYAEIACLEYPSFPTVPKKEEKKEEEKEEEEELLSDMLVFNF